MSWTYANNNPGGNSVWDTVDPNSNNVIRDGIVSDSGNSAIESLAKELGMKLTPETQDYLTQYYLNNKSSENAWNREMYSSSTQYQRAVEDLKKAGLNPYLAFDSLRGSNASSSAGSVSGNNYTQNKISKREAGTNTAKAIMTVLGIVAAAIIGAML